ncbi:hypothetical protein D3C72_2224200 [compost metagenome]
MVSNIITPFRFFIFKGGAQNIFCNRPPGAAFLALEDRWEGTYLEQRGAGEVGNNVRGALTTINRNDEFIDMTLAVLMTPD